MSDKIRPSHLQRRAVIYLRQSTLKQVVEHGESTRRQYALKARAEQLGWPVPSIEVVDTDLGQSGSSANWRAGFKRLAEDVAHGRVGGIFALDVSRFARSSADWHRLLELCRLADVVIGDEQSVYAPSDYGDRLLLGLQGTMSEAEQYWMRLRLDGGRLSKARRGEYRMNAPAGYVWDEEQCRFQIDPDEAVVRAVKLIFERFRLDGSAYAVTRYFAGAGLKVPVRDVTSRQITWQPPKHARVLAALHNPIYAGAYVYGRGEERMALVDGQLRRRHKKKLAQADWKVCLRDRHPAYISWEEYTVNQRTLQDNRTCGDAPARGAARAGEGLLCGLLMCGRCGRLMQVSYPGGRRVSYHCPGREPASRQCWSVAGRAIDQAVADLVLQAIQPAEIELTLAVAREVERQVDEVDSQWQLQIERARYEARLAERRYKAVDPDNRVVARTLESQWESCLRRVEELEHSHQKARQQKKLELTDEDRARILSLARDLPAVWNADTTTAAERKNLLRMLVKQVTISPIEVPRLATRLQVLWQTGAVSDFTIPRPSKYTTFRTPDEALALIEELYRQKVPDVAIADQLNQRGLRTGKARPWTVAAVQRQRYAHGWHLDSPKSRPASGRGELHSVHDVAQRTGVPVGVIRYWVTKGWLTPTEGGGSPGRPLLFALDQKMLSRLNSLKAKRERQAGRPPSQL
jgi:DNA invertase Pin-like site-specific DNA recombinase